MQILKEARKKMGYTQKEAAQVCGIARYYYIKIEHGVNLPSVKLAKKIAKVFGFEWTAFFPDEPEEQQ